METIPFSTKACYSQCVKSFSNRASRRFIGTAVDNFSDFEFLVSAFDTVEIDMLISRLASQNHLDRIS